MFKIFVLVVAAVQAFSLAQAGGYLPSELTYSASLPSPLPCAGEHEYNTAYGAPFAAPLPVAPVSGHHPYAAVSYSSHPIVKFHSSGGGFGFAPFTTYATVRSHHKFAAPAAVPSVYSAPPQITYASPAVSYSGFEAPNTVVKFGPPITTTTTTYSTTAAAAGGAPIAHPLNAVAGW